MAMVPLDHQRDVYVRGLLVLWARAMSVGIFELQSKKGYMRQESRQEKTMIKGVTKETTQLHSMMQIEQ